MYCQYPTYWNGSSCVTFARGGYASTPSSATTKGDWPSPECGGYYYNGSGTVTSTTGTSSVVYGTSSEVQPYYCKNNYIPQNKALSINSGIGYQKLASPVLGCKKLTYSDYNTNSYSCSECYIGFILSSTYKTCTKVLLGGSYVAERNKYGCAKCADATCTYCSSCHEGFSMECDSTTETFMTTECCKPYNSASHSKKYSYDIQMNNREIPF